MQAMDLSPNKSKDGQNGNTVIDGIITLLTVNPTLADGGNVLG